MRRLLTIALVTLAALSSSSSRGQESSDAAAPLDGGVADLAPAQELTPPPDLLPPEPANAGPRITVHAWEPERAAWFAPEEQAETAIGDVLAQDTRVRFSSFESLLTVDDAQPKLTQADNDATA